MPKPLTHEYVKDFIEKNNYIIINGVYKNSRSELTIRCQFCESETIIYFDYFKTRHNCQKCKNNKYIKEINSFAIKNSYKIINFIGKNYNIKAEIICNKGHVFFETYKNISRYDIKCKQCKNDNFINKANEIAIKRGGVCLSDKCVSVASKLKWRCEYGHEWISEFNTIRRGSWCGECSSGLGEKICRIYFETIFRKPFPRVRPEWIRNKNGKRLELDGFCEELKIAFEHNGFQHYKQISYYKYDIEGFNTIKTHDQIKIKLCKENNVKLIIIPELINILKIDLLKNFIKTECIRLNIELPKNYDDINIDIRQAYCGKVAEAKYLAKLKGGECLSEIFDKDKLLFKCNKDHLWECSLSKIRTGTWCKLCSVKNSRGKYTLQEIYIIAKNRDGVCLSTEYKNKDEKLLWKCKNNHIWAANLRNVKGNNSWCPKCCNIKNEC